VQTWCNPFRRKLFTENSLQTSRKWWQQKTPKSVKFALDVREHVPSGSRSILEFFIIEFITKCCKREGIETTQGNIEKILQHNSGDIRHARYKTHNRHQVNRWCWALLKEHDHLIEVLKALCLAQIVNLIEIHITFLHFFF